MATSWNDDLKARHCACIPACPRDTLYGRYCWPCADAIKRAKPHDHNRQAANRG